MKKRRAEVTRERTGSMLCNSAERPTRGPARHLIGTVEPDLDHAHHSGPNGKKASCFLSLRSRENLRVMARQRWQNRALVNSSGAGGWSAETAELSAVHVFELHPPDSVLAHRRRPAPLGARRAVRARRNLETARIPLVLFLPRAVAGPRHRRRGRSLDGLSVEARRIPFPFAA